MVPPLKSSLLRFLQGHRDFSPYSIWSFTSTVRWLSYLWLGIRGEYNSYKTTLIVVVVAWSSNINERVAFDWFLFDWQSTSIDHHPREENHQYFSLVNHNSRLNNDRLLLHQRLVLCRLRCFVLTNILLINPDFRFHEIRTRWRHVFSWCSSKKKCTQKIQLTTREHRHHSASASDHSFLSIQSRRRLNRCFSSSLGNSST